MSLTRYTGLALGSFAEAMEFAKIIAATEMVPDADRGKPGNILAKIQFGAEVGLPPMQAIQKLYVMKGKVGMEVTALRGLVEASGLLESLVRHWDEATNTATVTVTRKGRAPYAISFGPLEAVRAGLDRKETYKAWPQRMHMARAEGFALNDEFADVTRGLVPKEHLDDLGDDAPANVLVKSAPITAEFDRLRMRPGQRLVELAKFRDREPELLADLQARPTPAAPAPIEAKAESAPLDAGPAGDTVSEHGDPPELVTIPTPLYPAHTRNVADDAPIVGDVMGMMAVEVPTIPAGQPTPIHADDIFGAPGQRRRK